MRGSHLSLLSLHRTKDKGQIIQEKGQTELGGLETHANLLAIAATNRRDAIDPALLRAGRFDLQFVVDLPDVDTRLEILQVHNHDRPLANVNLSEWATMTEGWNGADLALLGDRAAVEAIRRYRGLGKSDPTAIQITTEDFRYAYDMLSQQRSG